MDDPALDVPLDPSLGALDRYKQPGEQHIGSLCPAPVDLMMAPLLTGELEDLEPMLGHRDAHALEELVVEVGDIIVLELIPGEGQPILVD